MDLTKSWTGDWDFDGFCFPVNVIEMAGKYYVSVETPSVPNLEKGAERSSGFSKIEANVGYYSMNDDVKILK